jgi:hypothetical protein
MIAERTHSKRVAILATVGLLIGLIASAAISDERARARHSHSCGALRLHEPQRHPIEGGLLTVQRATLHHCARFDDRAHHLSGTLAAFSFGEHDNVIRAQIEIACRDASRGDVRLVVSSYDRERFYRGLQ